MRAGLLLIGLAAAPLQALAAPAPPSPAATPVPAPDPTPAPAAAPAPPPPSFDPPGSRHATGAKPYSDATLFVPGMRFPVGDPNAYANSQVYGHGGSNGPGGGQCDAANYAYPWQD